MGCLQRKPAGLVRDVVSSEPLISLQNHVSEAILGTNSGKAGAQLGIRQGYAECWIAERLMCVCFRPNYTAVGSA